MARADLVAGIRNAIERGYTLEQAKASFISAGYKAEEVEEAARFASAPIAQPQQPAYPMPSPKVLPAKPPRRGWIKENWKIILLIGILVFLIIILILTFVFRDKIINFLT